MSAAYHLFYERAQVVGLSGEVQAMLVDDTYTFDATHASMAAAVAPHAIGDVIADVPVLTSMVNVTDPELLSDPFAVGWRAGPNGNVEFAHADTSYPVATLKAVVLYKADEPYLYLDHESFAALPSVTLGGAVELHLASDWYQTAPLRAGLAFGDWLVGVGP